MTALLSSQPQQDGEPVFDAPWQARSFAMAVKLSEAGLFTWKEWSERLAENIALYERDSAVSTSADYYGLWQQTVEQFVAERG